MESWEIMSLHRRTERLALVDSWIEEALFSDDTVSNTGIIAKRAGRDSCTRERPLLSARLAPSLRQPAEPRPNGESAEQTEWLAAFEPSLRYCSQR